MAFTNTDSWFSDSTTGFYPAPTSVTADNNLYISGTNTIDNATTTWSTVTNGTTWTSSAKKVNKKVVVKCSQCGAKIAEYWAKMPDYYANSIVTSDVKLGEEEDIMCETCHRIEKLKE